MEINLKDTKNNRPRIEWKDGKMVDASDGKQSCPRPYVDRKVVRTKAKKTQIPHAKAESGYADENESDILDFFISLKHKRHVLVAFFVILALSVTVAAIAVSLADGGLIELPPVDENITDENITDESEETQAVTEPPENNEVLPLVEEPSHMGHGHAVCIDPGHGFDDVGTSNNELGIYEKDIVLTVSLELREKLEDAGIKVYMTHDTNTPPPDSKKPYLFGMKKRTALANSLSDVSLYVSVHCDSFEDPSVHGSRIFHMSDEPDSESVANAIAEALINAGSEKKPIVKPMTGMDSYQVLRTTDMAAVLIETGFITNEEEAKRMLTDDWVEYMSGAIAEAIIKSFSDKVI